MPRRRAGLLLAAALAVLSCDRAAVTEPFVAPTLAPAPLVVTRGDLVERLVLIGELDSADSIELSAPRTDDWSISIRWLAPDGAAVEKGDRVVEFDNTSLLDRISEKELAAIEASVDLTTQQAKAAVESSDKKFDVRTQETEVAKAKLDTGVPEHLMSRRDARTAAVKLSQAEVALTTARGELEKIEDGGALEAKVKRIAYDKAVRAYETIEQQLDSLMLRAPRDGIVVIGMSPFEARKFEVGDNTFPGFAVAKLPDLSKMVVKASLSDVDEGRIHAGMEASCIVDAFADEPVPCTIRAVSPIAQDRGRKTTRRFFSVIVDLAESPERLRRPGLSVRVEVAARKAEDVFIAPRGGLDLSGHTPRARLVDGTAVDVEIDFCTPQACAVQGGLEVGQELRREETMGS